MSCCSIVHIEYVSTTCTCLTFISSIPSDTRTRVSIDTVNAVGSLQTWQTEAVVDNYAAIKYFTCIYLNK